MTSSSLLLSLTGRLPLPLPGRCLLLGALVVLGLHLATGSRAVAEDKPRVIRWAISSVGQQGQPIFGGNSVATTAVKGLLEAEFKADGIAIQWNCFRGAGPATNEAFANGLADFGWQGDLPAIIGKAGGLKTRLLLANGTRANLYVVVPSDSTAQTFADLRGRKFSLFKGTNGQLAVYKALKEHGLTDKDVLLINQDGATGRASIQTRDIDALSAGSEALGLRDRGVARILWDTRGKPAYLTRQTHVLVGEDFARRYPSIVQRVVNVLVKEAAWNSDEANRQEIFRTWAKSGVGYANYKEDYTGTALKQRQTPLFDEFFVTHYQNAVKAALDFKLIRKDIDVDAWIEPKFLNQALKDLNLVGHWEEYDAKGDAKTAISAVK